MDAASLPTQELLQVDVHLRLKDADRHAAGADAATHIGKKVVGVVEGEDDAFALEVRPQPAPIAGQAGLTGFGLLVRPLCLRPSGRCDMSNRAGASQRDNRQRPRPLPNRVHGSRPRDGSQASFSRELGKILWGVDRSGGSQHKGVPPASSHTIDGTIRRGAGGANRHRDRWLRGQTDRAQGGTGGAGATPARSSPSCCCSD